MDLGKLGRIKVQSVWPGEATSFTPWLAENLNELGAVLGIELELVEREAPVGSFSLDLLARDLSRKSPVAIENQFGATNHDHFGKILTYAAGYDASTVIWIAEEFREEHRQALDWLNQRTGSDVDFFGVVLELVKIDESRPALHFRLVASPNAWRKERVSRAQPSQRGDLYRAFFQPLVDMARSKYHFAGTRTAPAQNWVTFSSGLPGTAYNVSFAFGDRVRVEFYMDANDELFQALHGQKDAIELEFGEHLSWEPLEEKLASRIAIYRTGSILSSHEALTDIREWAVEMLRRFRDTLGPRLEDFKR